MTWHTEEPWAVDEICADCERYYYCSIREAAERRENHVVECGQFTKISQGEETEKKD